MDSVNWWQARRQRRQAARRKRQIARELVRPNTSDERAAGLEAELARILAAHPPENYYNPLGL